jgi:hypothetical protein
MAAVLDVSDSCLRALSELLTLDDVVGLFSAKPVSGGKYLEVIALPSCREFINLTPADVPEMLRFVELTKPGPFAPETIALASPTDAPHER